MSKNKRNIKQCHEALDDYRWMIEDAIMRGDMEEAASLRKSMKRTKNDLLSYKKKDGKEKRYASIQRNDELALAFCAF